MNRRHFVCDTISKCLVRMDNGTSAPVRFTEVEFTLDEKCLAADVAYRLCVRLRLSLFKCFLYISSV